MTSDVDLESLPPEAWAEFETDAGTKRRFGPDDVRASRKDEQSRFMHGLGVIWRVVGEGYERWASYCGVLLVTRACSPKNGGEARITCPDCLGRITRGEPEAVP